tara:strand:- start:119 stop:439 length:321 start_codon:yes stop_codon:yes gene_type:complete
MPNLIPGEIIIEEGFIELNSSKKSINLKVSNLGDRPIQVGSHFHFFETNKALKFNREQALGMRLDIPAGTAVRFEPGDSTEVTLIPYGGLRNVYGFNNLINGPLKN